MAYSLQPMVSDSDIQQIAVQVGRHLLASQRRLVTAESCTGGWIGKAVTDIAGSSAWFAGGAVVYSNELKQRVLGVEADVLARNGAVSEAVVCAMAAGARTVLGGNVSVAVSGVAGPDGGTAEKPVGTVWFAWSREFNGGGEVIAERQWFSGNREQIRRLAVAHALNRILEL